MTTEANPGDHEQVPLASDDARQAALTNQAKRGKGRLPPPSRMDLRRNHPLSLGRNNVSLHWDEAGRLRQASNLSEDAARELVRLNRRASDAAPMTAVREPKPGEPEHVMPLRAILEAYLAAGPSGALVHELIETATKGVIKRDHPMFEVYRDRINNTKARCAAALRKQGVVMWAENAAQGNRAFKRFCTGTHVPQGGEAVE